MLIRPKATLQKSFASSHNSGRPGSRPKALSLLPHVTVHPDSGGSQLSISFRIGEDNAPFHVISKIQTTKISINPTHSEYNAFSIATEHIKFYRHYLAWLGYPQEAPTPLENDCAPAFSILMVPHFPKNSKNLLVQDRNVREAYHDQIITPVLT